MNTQRAAGGSAIGPGPVLAIAAAILASLVAAVAVSAAPSDPSRIALVFPPWWSGARAIVAAASAGRILGGGGAPFIVIVRLDPATAARRARAAGALFILGADPASLCSSPLLEPRP